MSSDAFAEHFGANSAAPEIVVYPAAKIITMERSNPQAEAVAVREKQILLAGTFAEVQAFLGEVPYRVDETFATKTILPGFIDQHLHPLLGALTLAIEVIAPEDWILRERLSLPALTSSLLLMVLGLLLLGTTGCGSPSAPGVVPEPAPGSRITRGNIFTPVPFPMSPNSVGEINDAKVISASQKKAIRPTELASPPAPAPAPTMNSWFYLVNGTWFQNQDPTSPTPSPVPVLTVNGAAPYGAPNPNGGTGVGVAAMAPTLAQFQLWKAVPWNGNFFLRSAQSFEPSVNTGNLGTVLPNPLIGFGPYTVPLDLGYNSYSTNETTKAAQPLGIFWNQSGSPSGDQSAFQQWTYNTTNAQLTNVNSGGQLYIGADQNYVGIAPGMSAPDNQWYIYPDYVVNTVVNQANCDPPYPAWAPNATATPCTPVNNGSDAAGEEAAYNYFSHYILRIPSTVDLPTCPSEDPATTYTGIRCQYNIVSPAGGPLSTCVSVASSPSDAENSYPADSTPISTADWSAVANQLFSECQYAEGVQSLYSNFTTIIDTVFIDNSSQVINLANDVGLDSSTSVSAVPQALIEGIVYTVLSATGTAGGVLANLMETATNTVDAVQGNQPLTHPVAATVGTIYGDLATQFQSLEDQSANGENTILEDWGRLSVIGPRTGTLGYNGLALTPLDVSNIETQAENGYALTFLSQLMPAKYVMRLEAAISPSEGSGTNQWVYPTFGSLQPASSTIGYFFDMSGGSVTQASLNDLSQYGANSFEFMNGINMWNSETLMFDNVGCNDLVITLFNASPADLAVEVAPKGSGQGQVGAPGYDFPTGSTAPVTFELPPYGYLPIYTASGLLQDNMSLTVSDRQGFAAEFEATSNVTNGCIYNQALSPVRQIGGWAYAGAGSVNTFPAVPSTAAGLWVTIYNPNLQP